MRGAKLRAWISAALLFLTWAATVVSVFATCRPFQMMWQIFPDPGVICLPAISPILISVFLSCNVFTDIYLISLPIPPLLRAPLRKSQKLSLICLFSCNILITGLALTRAILMLKVRTKQSLCQKARADADSWAKSGPEAQQQRHVGYTRDFRSPDHHQHTTNSSFV